jgi:hypothetical protein
VLWQLSQQKERGGLCFPTTVFLSFDKEKKKKKKKKKKKRKVACMRCRLQQE